MTKKKNTQMSTDVDNYFAFGCGRCKLYQTPQCKVHSWTEELKALRRIALDCGLIEESKWGVPCYTYEKSNILIVSAFKEFASMSFFKGTLLNDEAGILVAPGENSQSARYAKFINVKDILKQEKVLKSYIFEAIEVEKAGLKVAFKKPDDFPLPEELENIFKKDAAYKKAFFALTPGKQRGYLLHFNQAKQTGTRISRIEKCRTKIMAGKGMQDY